MPATTAAAIAKASLSKLGLLTGNKAPQGSALATCMKALNTFADSLQLSRPFAHELLETVVQVTAGTVSMTLGPGADIDIPRPVFIADCSYIRVSGIDHRVEILDDRGWAGISQKTLTGSWPQALRFDGGMPTGNLFFWPQGGGELHLFTPTVSVSNFADATTSYELPPGYERMFIYNLAIEVAPDFEVTPRPVIFETAKSTRRAVKLANLTVPALSTPSLGGGRYTEADFIAGR